VIRLWDGMELKLIDSVDGDYDAVMVSYSSSVRKSLEMGSDISELLESVCSLGRIVW